MTKQNKLKLIPKYNVKTLSIIRDSCVYGICVTIYRLSTAANRDDALDLSFIIPNFQSRLHFV